MTMATRWRRIDARHWVHVLLVIELVLVSVATFVAVVWGLVLGVSPLLLSVLLLFPALSGWLTSAWRRERPWAWWVWTTLAALGVLSAVQALLTIGPGWLDLLGLLLNGVLLLLLCHPDSRARIQPVPADAVPRGSAAQRR